MEYITVRKASEKWGITPRWVQNMCKDGQIPGAVRMGRDWMIPVNARRPGIESEEACLPRKNPFLNMTDLYTVPGSGDEVAHSLEAGSEAAQLFAAQLAYSRGEIDKVYEETQKLLICNSCFEVQMGAGLLLSLCAMYRGDILLWNKAKQHIASVSCRDEQQRQQLMFWMAAMDSAIYDRAGYPDEFQRGCFAFLPKDCYAVARFFYAKYLYVSFNDSVLEKKTDVSLLYMLPPICELLITETKTEGALVSEIYLQLICAIAYHNSGQDALAVSHMDRAIELALPDRLYSPLAEYRRPLDYLLDDRLKEQSPEVFHKVKNLSRQLNDGWVVLHNEILNRSVTNDFTTREREVARFAAYGLSNQEIAERLHVSIHTVKNSLRVAMDKTGVKKRSELFNFI